MKHISLSLAIVYLLLVSCSTSDVKYGNYPIIIVNNQSSEQIKSLRFYSNKDEVSIININPKAIVEKEMNISGRDSSDGSYSFEIIRSNNDTIQKNNIGYYTNGNIDLKSFKLSYSDSLLIIEESTMGSDFIFMDTIIVK